MSIADHTNVSSPLLPFDQAAAPTPRGRKRGAARRTSEASLDAFEAIKRRRSKLYLPILQVIAEHSAATADCLTAREILRALKSNGTLPPDAERNNVSPRLTELLEAGCIENPTDPNDAARLFMKTVIGDSPASAWRITARGQLFVEHLEREQQREVA